MHGDAGAWAHPGGKSPANNALLPAASQPKPSDPGEAGQCARTDCADAVVLTVRVEVPEALATGLDAEARMLGAGVPPQ